jgi:hypothetical protein
MKKLIALLLVMLLFAQSLPAQNGTTTHLRVSGSNPPIMNCSPTTGDAIIANGVLWVCGPSPNQWTPQAYYSNGTLGLLNPSAGILVGAGTPSDGTTAVGRFALLNSSGQYVLATVDTTYPLTLIAYQTDAGVGNIGSCGSRYCAWGTQFGPVAVYFASARTAGNCVILDPATGGGKDAGIACISYTGAKTILGTSLTNETGGSTYVVDMAVQSKAATAGAGIIQCSSRSITDQIAAAGATFAQSCIIDGTRLIQGSVIEIVFNGTSTNADASAHSFGLAIKFGSVTVATTLPASTNAGVSGGAWQVIARFVVSTLNGATSKVQGHALGTFRISSGGSVTTVIDTNTTAEIGSIDLTGNLVITATGLGSVSFTSCSMNLDTVSARAQ